MTDGEPQPAGMGINLTSPSQVKSWCIANGFHPNRVLGQNFLIDRNKLLAIVDAGLPERGLGAPALRVLEVGPGLGVLTEELLARGAKVVAIEKDPILALRLPAALGNNPNLTVIEGDAIGYAKDLSRIAKIAEVEPVFDCMVSNLPYQSGTRILLDLVINREIPVMTALVQTEVAERLAASEGSKMRGLAGVWAQLDYDVKLVCKVAPSCFWPRPEIGSTVVQLTRHDRNISFSQAERKLFHSLTKTAFAHRRKQLGSIFKNMIKSTNRAEELSNENWVNLVKGLVNENA